jgi:hypothetical protein
VASWSFGGVSGLRSDADPRELSALWSVVNAKSVCCVVLGRTVIAMFEH